MAFVQKASSEFGQCSTNDGDVAIKPTAFKLNSPSSLAEICAKVVGQNIPFEAVQARHVPEQLQKRIAFWSFPLDESRLLRHAKLMKVNEHSAKQLFQPAESLPSSHRSRDCKDIITNVSQAGMHLTAKVNQDMKRSYSRDHDESANKTYSVGIQFDRGRLTSVKCSCSSRTDVWCEHVLALCLARIRGAVPVDLHPPLGETLSNFTNEQLQKMVLYLVEELSLEGLIPAVKIASQLEDSSSEMNRQSGAPDSTSGGSIGENASWSADESILEANLRRQLDKSRDGCRTKEKEITLMDLTEFRDFLHDHDENSAVVIGLVLSILSESSEMCLDKQQPVVADSYDRRSAEKRVQLCLALSEGLQVFFVDPIISKSCKSAVLELLSATQIEARSKGSVLLCHVLEAAMTYVHLSPRPTIEYINNTVSRIKQITFDTQKKSTDEPLAVAMIYSVSAVFSYWNFHLCPTDPSLLSAILDACQCLFLPVSEAHSFEEAANIQPGLQNVFLPVLMRNALIGVKHFSKGEYLLYRWQEVITLLFGNSSLQLLDAYALNCSTLEYFLAMSEMEKNSLKLCQQVYSGQHEGHIISPPLQSLLRDHFKQMPVKVDFTWPWMLLCLATYDRDMIEDVRKCVQAHISDPDSVLKKSQFPSAMADVLRERVMGLLQHLFANLPEEASLELFKVLDAAFPSNHIRSEKERSVASKYLKFESNVASTFVLPNSSLSITSFILERNDFRRVDSKFYIVVREAVLCKVAISSDHISLLKNIFCQDAPNIPAPIVLLLQILACRVSFCYTATLQNSLSHDVPVHNLSKFDIEAVKYATQYLHECKYCMTPVGLIHLLSYICTGQSSGSSTDAGCKQQLSRLAVDEIGAITKNMLFFALPPQSMKMLINALSAVSHPDLLLLLPTLIHDKFSSRPDTCVMEQVARTLGVMYISSDAASKSHHSDIMFRLKSAFMKELDCLVARFKDCSHNFADKSSSQRVLANPVFPTRTNTYFDLDVRQWAEIVTAVGGGAVNALLKIIEHRPTQSLSPWCQRIADVGIVWTRYQQALPSQGTGVLEVPAFKAVLEPLLTQEEDQVCKYVRANKNDKEKILRAMLLLAALYQPLQLYSNFSSFAFKIMKHVCTSKDEKEMIQSRFIATFLSEIILEQSMEELLLIDLQVEEDLPSRHFFQAATPTCGYTTVLDDDHHSGNGYDDDDYNCYGNNWYDNSDEHEHVYDSDY